MPALLYRNIEYLSTYFLSVVHLLVFNFGFGILNAEVRKYFVHVRTALTRNSMHVTQILTHVRHC